MVWNVEASRTVAVVYEFPWSSFVHCAAAGAGPLPSHATRAPATTSDRNLMWYIMTDPSLWNPDDGRFLSNFLWSVDPFRHTLFIVGQ